MCCCVFWRYDGWICLPEGFLKASQNQRNYLLRDSAVLDPNQFLHIIIPMITAITLCNDIVNLISANAAALL